MTISIKPTVSGSTIEQDGGTILSVDGSGNLTVPNNITFSGTVNGVSSYSDSDALSLLNASGSAPVYACRAWVLFHGTGTVSVGNSGNVSSVTDAATGRYVINITTALPAVTYAVVTNSGISSYTDSDALTLFNASGSAPVYACRAWVNFNGTGTVSIYNSGNVSSITDNGTGQYTANFTTAMPDVDYAVAGATNEDNGTAQRVFTERTGRTASSVGVVVGDVNGTERDHARISVIIVR